MPDKTNLSNSDRDLIYSELCNITTVLNSMSINWFLGHGACLGAVRGGDLLLHDRDIDIMIVEKDLNIIKPVIKALEDSNLFKRIYSRADTHWRIVCKNPIERTKELRSCVYFYMSWNDDFQYTHVKPKLSESGKFFVPSFLLKEKTYAKIRDLVVPIPTPPDLYLEWLYGKTWRIPDKRRGFKNFATTHLRIEEDAIKYLKEMR